jgi:hypothetical protein
MQRKTVERILAARGAKPTEEGLSIAEDEVATLLLGGDPPVAVQGVVRFRLHEDVLEGVSREGARTYLEYDALRALTFEPKGVADRRSGF